MQRELVDQRKQLPNTAAGIELRSELEEQKKRHRKEMQELRRDRDDAMAKKDALHREEMRTIQEEYEKLQNQLRTVQEELRRLKSKDRTQKPKGKYSLTRAGGMIPSNDGSTKVIYVTRYRRGSGCLSGDGFEL